VKEVNPVVIQWERHFPGRKRIVEQHITLSRDQITKLMFLAKDADTKEGEGNIVKEKTQLAAAWERRQSGGGNLQSKLIGNSRAGIKKSTGISKGSWGPPLQRVHVLG